MLGGGLVVCEELYNLGYVVVVLSPPPPLPFYFNVHTNKQNISRNELARPIMGTIFLVYLYVFILLSPLLANTHQYRGDSAACWYSGGETSQST